MIQKSLKKIPTKKIVQIRKLVIENRFLTKIFLGRETEKIDCTKTFCIYRSTTSLKITSNKVTFHKILQKFSYNFWLESKNNKEKTLSGAIKIEKKVYIKKDSSNFLEFS